MRNTTKTIKKITKNMTGSISDTEVDKSIAIKAGPKDTANKK